MRTQKIEPLGHDYIVSVIQPTCTAEGYTVHKCARCGDSYTDCPVPALGHMFGEWHVSVEPTCTSAGEQVRICLNCGEEELRSIPQKEHTYTATTVSAGCETQGYTLYECTQCGVSYTAQLTPALGHDFVVVEEGYTAQGAPYTKYQCTRCNAEKTEIGDIPEGTSGLQYSLSADGTSYIVTGIDVTESVSLVIPSVYGGLPVYEIADSAFSGNSFITDVNISYGLRKIGESAFKNCVALLSVTIPETVESIGNDAFRACAMLENVYFNTVRVESCSMNIFYNAGVSGSGITLTIGKDVQIIPANMFYAVKAPRLTCVVLSEDSALTEIGDAAFSGCSYLKSVELPSEFEKIGIEAFYGCTSLEYVRLPEKAVIGSGAFVDVPDDVVIERY